MKIATGMHAERAHAPAGSGADRTTVPAAEGGERAAGVEQASRFAARHERPVLITTWALSALYVGACLKRGWVPSDAGTFAQTAERVLHGQVPFRDFIEPYTGGLTYLNALAFRVFGTNLFSIRIPPFVLFLGWVPVVYFITRRFAGPFAAGLATLLAVAWSFPNYTEAMPSWYNLFFATFGTAALLRYIQNPRQRWLWIAGLCGGLSIVVKITGLYFVAAGLLFFAFREQALSSGTAARPARRGGLYRLFLIVCLILFLAALLDTVWQQPGLAAFAHFVLPGALLAALLRRREYESAPGADRARFRALFSMALPFLAGAAIPVGVLLLGYARTNALRGFLDVTFALNVRRMQWMTTESVSPLLLVGVVPGLIVFLAACSRKESSRRSAGRAAPILFAALLLASWKSWGVYELVGLSVSLIVPLLALAALVLLRPTSAVPEAKSEPILLVVSVAVLCALIQFPFAQPTYFYYVAPLAVLAVLSLSSLRPVAASGRVAIGSLMAFYLVLPLWLATPGFLITNGLDTHRDLKMQTLPFARAGGIRMIPQEEREYARLIPLVQGHARGRFIYAAPDCPEVYFLSGLENPTPTLYEFLDPDFLNVPARTGRIFATIESHGVHVVVLKDSSSTSGAIPAELRAALDARFPQSARVDHFEVRWKP